MIDVTVQVTIYDKNGPRVGFAVAKLGAQEAATFVQTSA